MLIIIPSRNNGYQRPFADLMSPATGQTDSLIDDPDHPVPTATDLEIRQRLDELASEALSDSIETNQFTVIPPSPPDSEVDSTTLKKFVDLSPGSLIGGTLKLNRRNNPELERRRVHFCNFPTCNKAYTKSSHLKAHQRLHTGIF